VVDKARLRYDGRGFAEWQEQFVTELDPAARLKSLPALLKFGKNGYAEEAAATIVIALDDDAPELVMAAASALKDLGRASVPVLVDGLKTAKKECLGRYVQTLGQIGEGAELAVPALLGIFKQHSKALDANKQDGNQEEDFFLYTTGIALEQLAAGAAPAVPQLIGLLSGENETVRYFAASVLERIGPAGAEALPALRKALGDQDPHVRSRVAGALWRIAPADEQNVETLLRAIREGDAYAGRGLLEAFGRPLDPEPMMPLDPEPMALRPEGRLPYGLDEVARANIATVKRLTQTVLTSDSFRKPEDDGGLLQEAMSEVLTHLGPEAEFAVPALIETVESAEASHHDRVQAAVVLGAIGPQSKAAIPALQKFLGQYKDGRWIDPPNAGPVSTDPYASPHGSASYGSTDQSYSTVIEALRKISVKTVDNANGGSKQRKR
jgi:HEAT repeat protein